jgi:hypothetical protein
VHGYVAQWIEHQIPVLRVGGSNPSILVLIKALKLNDFALFQGFLPLVGYSANLQISDRQTLRPQSSKYSDVSICLIDAQN